MLTIAQVDAPRDDARPRHFPIPPVAPRIRVVVPVKQPHEAGRRGQGLHKRHVEPAIPAPGVVPVLRAVCAPPLRLLRHLLEVDARVAVGVDSALRVGRRIRGDVNERKRGDHAACPLDELGIRPLEPFYHRGVYPVGLGGGRSRRRWPLVVRASAGVEEPEEELGVAGRGVLARAGVYGQEVVGYAGLGGPDHALRPRPDVLVFAVEDVFGGQGEGVVVVAVGRGPCELALDKRRDQRVDVVCAVVLEGDFSGDEIAVEHDKVWAVLVEDIGHDLNRLVVLLGPAGGCGSWPRLVGVESVDQGGRRYAHSAR